MEKQYVLRPTGAVAEWCISGREHMADRPSQEALSVGSGILINNMGNIPSP